MGEDEGDGVGPEKKRQCQLMYLEEMYLCIKRLCKVTVLPFVGWSVGDLVVVVGDVVGVLDGLDVGVLVGAFV